MSGWTGTGTAFAGAAVQNYCDSKGYFGGYLDGEVIPGSFRAQWLFEAPLNTDIRSYVFYRIAFSATTSTGGSKNYDAFEDEVSFDSQHLIDLCAANAPKPCTSLGNPEAPLSETNRLSRSGRHARRLYFIAQCFAYNSCGRSGLTGFAIYQGQIDLGEESQPLVAPLTGELISRNTTITGSGAVSFTASDSGGGIERAELLVDGVRVASQGMEGQQADCRRPFLTTVPCPLSVNVELPVDTTTLPDGSHRLQARVTDVAGNVGLSGAIRITTKNSSGPVVPNGAAADRSARLSVSFRGRRLRTVGFRRRAQASGRLVTSAGQPIAGALVAVHARVQQVGARWRGVSILKTGARGGFRYRPPRGPSRAFRFVYRAYSSDRRPTAARTVRLQVRAGIRLSVSPHFLRNGRTAAFRVRLLGGPGRKGTLVSVQVLRPQKTTFATRGVGRSGIVTVLHRFRYTYRPTTYLFRAVVQPQRGYPYLGASSGVVRLRVRP